MIRILLAAAIAPLLFANTAPDPDLPGIRTVIETFRTAIIAKDRAALERLPANDTITFIAAFDAETFTRVRARRPEAKRNPASTYAKFVDDIVTDPAKLEERFRNIRIQSDGAVATVWFDYDFVENGKVTNWGHESWGLIRTDAGWRISSIIYSITLPTKP